MTTATMPRPASEKASPHGRSGDPAWARTALLASLAAVTSLAGPAAYALDTVGTPHTGAIVTAGPSTGGGPGGMRGESGSDDAHRINAWAQENFTAQTVGGVTLYDLTARG
ncbi:hypothetical protein ACFVH6_27255 [Spirillospora sp. NPDC127200]